MQEDGNQPMLCTIGDIMINGSIFICKRHGAYWTDGLVIYAASEQKAIEIYKKHEETDNEPYHIIKLNLLHGVLYDDIER